MITRKKSSSSNELQHGIIGLVTEIGEIADTYKKHVFYDQPLDKENIIEEIGDVLWYLALVARAINSNLDDIAESNVLKLKKRYPNGFTELAALERLDKE